LDLGAPRHHRLSLPPNKGSTHARISRERWAPRPVVAAAVVVEKEREGGERFGRYP
jgi:hypothetical protein